MTGVSISQIHDLIQSKSFLDYGFAPFETPISIEIYEKWINDNQHGDMDFLRSHLPQKSNPNEHFPSARSAIVFLKSYKPHPAPIDDDAIQHLNVALYAKGEDYHLFFKNEMSALCNELSNLYPGEHFSTFTDSHPIMERDLAYKAGLGWFGKNSCLIQQSRGSLFFIGEILTSMDLQSFKDPHPDRCGTCTKCIDACPTHAIDEQQRTIDSSLCISYLNIEKKDSPPVELREKMGDWFFGCDICQTVCPWNEKVFQFKKSESEKSNATDMERTICDILESSNKSLQKRFAVTPLSRARGRGLKRNAIIVATNKKLFGCLPSIQKIKSEKNELEELCTWSINQFEN